MKKIIITILIIHLIPIAALTQGFNHTWLLGTDTGFPMERLEFSLNSFNLQQKQTKMTFDGTEATLCDNNGNFLMSSNGVWIANSNNDTMQNGSGLNPSVFTSSYPHGLLLPYANIILPYPGDTSKFVLFHHSAEFDGISYPANDIFYTIIDMTLDSGRGAVISKNNIALNDTLNWGLAACRHANGRDWWVVSLKENSDIVFKILFTDIGIQSITAQQLNVPFIYYNMGQPTFSPDGSKFSYYFSDGGSVPEHDIRIFDFDRCSGIFSNPNVVNLYDGDIGWGLAFSPNGKYVYSNSSQHVFQIDVNTLSVDTVATYDGFCYPNNPWCTTFFNMYLAANGKIYITSGNAVQHIHEMNYPDSAGLACNVQQHSIFLNGIWYFRAVPNHPNYYLGCDTTLGCPCLITTGSPPTPEGGDFRFRLYPNPISNNNLSIGYLLPQNKAGVFQIIDVTGKVVFKYNLPQWSNEQSFSLPDLSNGVYSCVITSNGYRVSKKLVVIK